MQLSRHFAPRPDGSQICWYLAGSSGPVLMLANGLGGPVSALRPYLSHFAESWRVVTWDYRGLYGSRLGADACLDMSAHATDAAAVARALGQPIDTYVGWSMGVQVGLELYRQEPEIIRRFVLMNGTAGRPFDGILPRPGPQVLGGLVRGARHLRFLAPSLVRAMRDAPHADVVLKRLGFIADEFSAELYREVLADFESLDFDVYFRMLAALGHHDAGSVLPTVTIPTLVISGTKDRITPPHLGRRLAQGIQGAEYFLLPSGSHYAAAEYPELVIARISAFLEASTAPRHPGPLASGLPGVLPGGLSGVATGTPPAGCDEVARLPV